MRFIQFTHIQSPTVLLLCLLSFSVFAQEPTFYKYKDDQDITVISNTLPPSKANEGYSIVTARGNVIETIPPKRTPEDIAKEKALALEKEKEHQLVEQEQKAQQELIRKDQVLLQTFTTEEDIENLKKDKLSNVEILISITEGNITRLQKQLIDARTRENTFKEEGKAIPQELKETIDNSLDQIETNQAFVEKKQQENLNITNTFDDMKKRFRILKNIQKDSMNQELKRDI